MDRLNLFKNFLFISVLLIIGTSISSCNKDDESRAQVIEYESMGVLFGFDASRCICCGSWIVKLEDTLIDYRIEVFPEDFEVNSDELPREIEINWTLNRDCQGILYIDVDDIRYIE